ncbi:hypothetical protein AB4090_02650 [Acidithiobacillus sp. IBUN Pt1247-S3]|uniref:hypothetical protein n=1 Tax=Acidithiobacillus sp. IBUN Pt1247-S3 TaxID=3166642 RepID=UPI0034E4240F
MNAAPIGCVPVLRRANVSGAATSAAGLAVTTQRGDERGRGRVTLSTRLRQRAVRRHGRARYMN